jgi:hypothetical protein
MVCLGGGIVKDAWVFNFWITELALVDCSVSFNSKKNLLKVAFTSSLLLTFQYHLPFWIKDLLGSSPTTYLPND